MKPWTDRLNDTLRQSGWSKTELARRSGVNYDSLNKYLDGKVAQPRGDIMHRLARALGVDTTWLRDGTGDQDRDPDQDRGRGGGRKKRTSTRGRRKGKPPYDGLTQLGGPAEIPASPDIAILETVKNPHPGDGYVVRFTCPEFTSLCPVTGQPDFAHLVVDYVPAKSLVESKSLRLYLASFRNFGAFHEDCTLTVAKSIIKACKPKWLRIGGYWYPRGGIPIDVFWQSGAPPKDVWLPAPGVAPYRGRG